MRVKIITLPFSEGKFSDETLQEFIAEKHIIDIREHFFIHQEIPYLTFGIHYAASESKISGQKSERKVIELTAEETQLYEKLRHWRNERAEKEGYVPYALFTNQQLKEIVKLNPQTLTNLQTIHGVGSSRVEKYGRDVLALVAVQTPCNKKMKKSTADTKEHDGERSQRGQKQQTQEPS